MNSIITGASGALGRLTAEAVLDTFPGAGLILVTRDTGSLRDLAARGALVRYGDVDEPDSLCAAFAGGERMLLIGTGRAGHRVAGHRRAVDAAVFAGVRTLGYLSAVNPTDSNPLFAAGDHRETEEYIRTSGLGWTLLRASPRAEALVPAARAALASGVHLSNSGQGRTSYVSRSDCAAVGATFLCSRDERHTGKTYDITGPEALSAEDVAAVFAGLGRGPVTASLVDDDTWVTATVRRTGLPEATIRLRSTAGVAARRGYTATVSTAVREFTGAPPRPLRDVLGGLL